MEIGFFLTTALGTRTTPVALMWVLSVLALFCSNPTHPDLLDGKGKTGASVEVKPDSMTLQTGDVGQATCSPKNKFGVVLANACNWKSWDTTVAAVTSGGPQSASVTAKKVGQAWIVAGASGKPDSFRLTVVDTVAPATKPCARTVNASTLSGFTSALAGALPGDCIFLAPGTYILTSALTITRSGTAAAPIVVQGGGSNTIIDVAQKGLSLDASYVQLRRMRLTNFGVTGLYLHGAGYSVLDSMEIDHTLQWAVALKNASHHNVIKNSLIHDTGILRPYWGEGIYIGNSGDPGFPLDFGVTDNQVLNNHFGPNVRSAAVILCVGADRTLIQGNVIDGTGTEWVPGQGSNSLVSIYASSVTIDSNFIQYGSPRAVTFYAPSVGTMSGNVATRNTINLQNIHNVTFPVVGFQFTRGTVGGAAVSCNNVMLSGKLSDQPCSP
jgi:hypothetical protein